MGLDVKVKGSLHKKIASPTIRYVLIIIPSAIVVFAFWFFTRSGHQKAGLLESNIPENKAQNSYEQHGKNNMMNTYYGPVTQIITPISKDTSSKGVNGKSTDHKTPSNDAINSSSNKAARGGIILKNITATHNVYGMYLSKDSNVTIDSAKLDSNRFGVKIE